ncbi:ArnT family glycosyltransferase [Rubellimicrobium rubrum]|nr:glycosyltransferase family 39 protein [Rubellimicrobium rubrum]
MTYRLPVALLACVIFAALCVAFVLLRPLLPLDETRYLTVAWEMWIGGSKLVPHLNGDLYGHKPPFLFWLVNIVWAIGGVSELAARLVAPSFGVFSVALTALLARQLWPEQTDRGGRAALILATTGVFLLFGSATMFDAMLTASVLLAMIALWHLVHDGRARWAVLLGAAVALGVYAKGPVVLVHVVPTALLAPVWRDRTTSLPLARYLLRLGQALLVALGLVALWLVPALLLGGAEYREEVLWRQSAGRVVQAFAHQRPWWWFLAVLPIYLWPWAWSPAALAALSPRALAREEGSRFLVVWALSALVAFSFISGKQTHYLLPELPSVALLLAASTREGSRGWRVFAFLPALLLFVLGPALALGVIGTADLPDLSMPLVPVLAAMALVALLAGALWRVPGQVAATAFVAPLTLLAFHALAATILALTHDPSRIGRILAAHQDAGLAIQEAGYHGQFGFAGRLSVPLNVVPRPEDVAAWAAAHPGGIIVSEHPLDAQGYSVIARQPFRGGVYTIYQVAKEAS